MTDREFAEAMLKGLNERGHVFTAEAEERMVDDLEEVINEAREAAIYSCPLCGTDPS